MMVRTPRNAGVLQGRILQPSLTVVKISGSGGDGSGHVLGTEVQYMYIVAAMLVDGIDDGLCFTPADPAASPHSKGFAKGLEIVTATLGRSFDLGFFYGVAQTNIHRSEIINNNDF